MSDQKLEARALAASDLPAMMDVAEAVQRAPASAAVLEAASAARRSIRSAMQKESDTRRDVARIRFEKLAAVLE
ncbi:hypothetical protein [Bosea sp. 124]|uniref:hypothetical protein n=1 Tax=Bosea sp. 124 TaxID=2135642 RepID=UPI0011B1C632|nr:hypothetical protein [Bosea sp. 124]